MTPLLLAALAGLLIGLSLGTLGGGGSILAVPVLLALGQSAGQATTGSLVVVATSSLVAAVAARRAGGPAAVLVGRGLVFGALAVGGAGIGARAAGGVPDRVLLLCFAALLALVAGLMVRRQVGARRGTSGGRQRRASAAVDEPIITIRPDFTCACPRAVTLVVGATVVGLLTGFLGVGGGFLVVPALVLAFGLPMSTAAGTSLVAITVTSLTALGLRLDGAATPDWPLVALLAGTAVAGALVGTRLARRAEEGRLQVAFTGLLVAVALWTAVRALLALG